jgi:hypothetical protein
MVLNPNHPFKLFVLLLALVCGLGVQSLKSQEQTKQPTQQKKERASSPQNEVRPTAPQSGPVGQPTPHTENKRETEKNEYLKHVLSPEILPNWLLFVVGATGVYFAWRTLRGIEIQTSALNTTAEAAKKSAEVAEQALRISERADILLNAAVFRHGTVLSGNDAFVEIEFKNFGRTRALNVQLSLNLAIEGVPSTDCKLIPPITMGAGDIKRVNSDYFVKFLTLPTAADIFQGQLALRFEAQASYEDVFGQKHTTHATGLLNSAKGTFLIESEKSD